MTIHLAIMLVITIMRPKHSWTHGAGEMIDVVFAIERCDVGPPERSAALVTEQPETSKVIRLAKRILSTSVLVVGREKLGGDNLATVL